MEYNKNLRNLIGVIAFEIKLRQQEPYKYSCLNISYKQHNRESLGRIERASPGGVKENDY